LVHSYIYFEVIGKLHFKVETLPSHIIRERHELSLSLLLLHPPTLNLTHTTKHTHTLSLILGVREEPLLKSMQAHRSRVDNHNANIDSFQKLKYLLYFLSLSLFRSLYLFTSESLYAVTEKRKLRSFDSILRLYSAFS